MRNWCCLEYKDVAKVLLINADQSIGQSIDQSTSQLSNRQPIREINPLKINHD